MFPLKRKIMTITCIYLVAELVVSTYNNKREDKHSGAGSSVYARHDCVVSGFVVFIEGLLY